MKKGTRIFTNVGLTIFYFLFTTAVCGGIFAWVLLDMLNGNETATLPILLIFPALYLVFIFIMFSAILQWIVFDENGARVKCIFGTVNYMPWEKVVKVELRNAFVYGVVTGTYIVITDDRPPYRWDDNAATNSKKGLIKLANTEKNREIIAQFCPADKIVYTERD